MEMEKNAQWGRTVKMGENSPGEFSERPVNFGTLAGKSRRAGRNRLPLKTPRPSGTGLL